MIAVRPLFAYVLSAALFLAALPGVLNGQPQQFEGQKIVNIRFDPQRQPLEPEELFQILPLKNGEPLRMDVIRASIERMFATGRYAISKWMRSRMPMVSLLPFAHRTVGSSETSSPPGG